MTQIYFRRVTQHLRSAAAVQMNECHLAMHAVPVFECARVCRLMWFCTAGQWIHLKITPPPPSAGVIAGAIESRAPTPKPAASADRTYIVYYTFTACCFYCMCWCQVARNKTHLLLLLFYVPKSAFIVKGTSFRAARALKARRIYFCRWCLFSLVEIWFCFMWVPPVYSLGEFIWSHYCCLRIF